MNPDRGPAEVELLIISESGSEYLAVDCLAEPSSPTSDTSSVRLRNSARLSREARRLSRVVTLEELPKKVSSRSPVSASYDI